ncbi:MAG: hypothetical protein V5A62_17740 [Haloarculaceae archaeon]
MTVGEGGQLPYREASPESFEVGEGRRSACFRADENHPDWGSDPLEGDRTPAEADD